jgi:hypothetical protein
MASPTPVPGGNLRRATYRVLHSIKRRAAGEHSLPTDLIVLAFVEEWDLGQIESALLQMEVNRLERTIAARHQEAS